ncbi:MAG: CYTH domain-containing protein [Blautia sp.]|nr:CYTH domain-containing protein [Blautia sp.]
MEIERKWMVNGWPEGLPLEKEELMRQGYVTVVPTVRIREERTVTEGQQKTEFILCFKSAGGLSRQEIEFPIEEENFRRVEELIARPLIPKLRRTYLLPDGHRLEVNHVDEGEPTEFWYAEIEYDTEEEALAWKPESDELAAFLDDEVTGKPGQSMGAYWMQTRVM